MYCWEYNEWRKKVFQKDDFTCICGIRSGRLQAHHIKAFTAIMAENNITTLEQALACKELWDVNNGQTMHKKCHTDLHTNLKKKHKIYKIKQ